MKYAVTQAILHDQVRLGKLLGINLNTSDVNDDFRMVFEDNVGLTLNVDINGKTFAGFVPVGSVKMVVPADQTPFLIPKKAPKKDVKRVVEAQVPKKIKAQHETPMSHTFAGQGHGKQ